MLSSELFCWEGDMLINDFRLTDFMINDFSIRFRLVAEKKKKLKPALSGGWLVFATFQLDQHDRQTDRQADRQTDRQAGRQAGRQTDRQTDRQIDR